MPRNPAKRMKYIALNGLLCPVDRFFGHSVDTPYRANWTAWKADRLSETITSPTMICGFSDGAGAALRIAFRNPNVTAVYAHSPESYSGPIHRIPSQITFFRTEGDRTPTYEGAYQSYLRIAKERDRFQQSAHVGFHTLPFSPIPGRTFRERLLRLEKMRHVFHNCLAHLPSGFR